jgi:hypothetical protein
MWSCAGPCSRCSPSPPRAAAAPSTVRHTARPRSAGPRLPAASRSRSRRGPEPVTGFVGAARAAAPGARRSCTGPPSSRSRSAKAGTGRRPSFHPMRQTVLAQWSGECEQQRTFFIPAGGGKPRVATGEHDWTKSPESEAIGWRGSHALVRLRGAGETPATKPGVYLVDPRTFHRTLPTPIKRSFTC